MLQRLLCVHADFELLQEGVSGSGVIMGWSWESPDASQRAKALESHFALWALENGCILFLLWRVSSMRLDNNNSCYNIVTCDSKRSWDVHRVFLFIFIMIIWIDFVPTWESWLFWVIFDVSVGTGRTYGKVKMDFSSNLRPEPGLMVEMKLFAWWLGRFRAYNTYTEKTKRECVTSSCDNLLIIVQAEELPAYPVEKRRKVRCQCTL